MQAFWAVSIQPVSVWKQGLQYTSSRCAGTLQLPVLESRVWPSIGWLAETYDRPTVANLLGRLPSRRFVVYQCQRVHLLRGEWRGGKNTSTHTVHFDYFVIVLEMWWGQNQASMAVSVRSSISDKNIVTYILLLPCSTNSSCQSPVQSSIYSFKIKVSDQILVDVFHRSH